LRDYGIEGQIGLEDHPQKYIGRMVEIFREVRRVLRRDGSLYLNMGDTYYGGAGGRSPENCHDPEWQREATALNRKCPPYRSNWLRPKQKLMIPARLAIALQDDGWLLRNDIIWYKRNHMPSSVKDRLANAYEHIFFFVRSDRYYYDLDAIREAPAEISVERLKYPLRELTPLSDGRGLTNRASLSKNIKLEMHPIGVNPGDVFQSNKAPYQKNNPHTMRLDAGGHIALDPSRPMDLSHPNGANPGDVLKEADCPEALNSPRARTLREGYDAEAHFYNPNGKNPGDFWDITTRAYPEAHFATFPPMLCVRPILASCPPEGIVLDIFAGSGTACAVAKALGRKWLGIEINPKYVALAEKRIGKVITPLAPVLKVKDAEKALNGLQEVMG
jgi:DNA modification methylase